MTHNVTLPLRSCLHTRLRERGERGERMGQGEGGSGSGSGRGEAGYGIKVVEG